uniref:alanine transaminase n=1 Tax=Sander lucioperca TaxID=283035 RepID=A0A8C9XYM1_SANLU
MAPAICLGVTKPFQQVIDVSSGDPHRAGMAPMSFVRQVLAVCLYPELLTEKSLPLDARQRAQKLMGACSGGSVGSYSLTSCGIPCIQKSVAEFIMRRDGGVSSNPEDIIFSSGSQKTMVLHLLASGEGETQTGVLTPRPCPHTLPPLLDEAGVTLVPYQLMEDRGWTVDLDELHQALKTARGRCEPRAIYISNPGNPTGDVASKSCSHQFLVLNNVYQDSVYGQEKEFISYKRVLFEMDKEYSETVELVSFHSISSACMGEAGLRGGYMEVINMDPAVNKYLRSMQDSSSPPVLPQLALEIMVNPPTPGQPSYKMYSQGKSKKSIIMGVYLSERACEFLNDLPGVNCQPGMGGVFLYPCLHLPPQMIEEAKMLGVEADVLYCQKLLEEEGICLGAGCENGHEDPNYHISPIQEPLVHLILFLIKFDIYFIFYFLVR